MLELKQLTKIYQTKGGTETKALDDVSVSFGETGLVFLLGKSGSGKSTMLNLAGGLDEPTSGEIVVMGKSSKNFTGSDFDSYRNTFVGFVFQEYNVLDEFTVEENVSLALELQGSTKSGDKVKKILDEVELGEFSKRKPNTLSGGQKQRVAIARALVKEPKIILADEPTGALDSETGKQVFETLKKLSETRLVIVVSHDREFAETYGDRIIELKDGKIISDASITDDNGDTAETQEVILNEKLFDNIRTFLADDNKKTYKDFLHSKGVRTGANMFEPTPPQTLKEYDGEQIAFIRSRLPFRKALKIGASGLKLKPFRLIMTIFLSVIAFIMFGLLSTMTFYNVDRVLANSLDESGYNYVMMEKNHVVRNYHAGYGGVYENTYRARITPGDVATQDETALGAYRLNIPGQSNIGKSDSNYYMLSLRYVASAPENHPFRSESFTGSYPTKATEIAVSSYFLEVLKHSSFTTVSESGTLGKRKNITQASDLIGERVFISSVEATFIVTGIFDSGTVPNRFEELKKFSYDTGYQRLLASYYSYISSSVHSLILVSNDFYTQFGEVIGDNVTEVDYFERTLDGYDFGVTISEETKRLFDGNKGLLKPYNADPDARQRPITFFGEPKDELAANEVILPLYSIAVYYSFLAEEITTETEQEAYNIFESACHALIYGRLTNITEIERNKAIVLDYVAAHPMETLTLFENGRIKGTADVVGFYRTTYGYTYYSDGFYCSQAFYDEAYLSNTPREETNYRPEEDAGYDFILCPPGRSDAARLAFAKILGERNADPDSDVFYSLDNPVYDNVKTANELIELLSTVFLWVGIAMALFASLLLFNFISVSITNKKKEIGILRAVGAKGTDVFKIFFSESGVIVGICTVLSIIGTIAISAVLNSVMRTKLGLFVSLFVFGPLSVVTLIGIAVAVAVLATFMPVYFAAKKKPVESIRAL